MDGDFWVRVQCMTYNHAAYIEDAMNGFCIQETTFPYICVIIDDASTDGEQEVLLKYYYDHFDCSPKSVAYKKETEDYQLFFAQHQCNQNCYFAIFLLKYNHYCLPKSKLPYLDTWANSKYVAICEGDDYWTVEYKLQKQVEWLETHLNYSACLHDTIQHHLIDNNYAVLQDGEVYDSLFLNLKKDRDASAKDMILCKVWPHVSSLLIRNSIYCQKPDCFTINESGDWQLFMYASFSGKVRLMKDVMSVYRKGVEGSYTMRMGHNNQARASHMMHKIEMLNKVDDYYHGKYNKPITLAINRMKYSLSVITGNKQILYETSFWFRVRVLCLKIIRRFVRIG